MDTRIIRSKFERADYFFESAHGELNRLSEDVVLYILSRSSCKLITPLFKGFLLENNIEFNEKDTLEVLLRKLKIINSSFNNFDLSSITFITDYDHSAKFYQMKSCVYLANHTKKIVGQL